MKFIVPILLAVFAVVGVSCGYKKLRDKKIICDLPYALCTSAQCIPSPNDPNELICFCEAHAGKSLGHTPCEKRTLFADQAGAQHVISTFSLDDFSKKRVMTCSEGSPWADCLDQPCTVDPLDPSKAICSCKRVSSGPFQTLGGNCNKSTCDKGFWSGATIEANRENIKTLLNAFGMNRSPQRNCPE